MTKINFGGTEEEVITRDEFPLEKARQVLKDEVVAVLGYGVQGPAQAMNMRDNGITVIVGQRGGTKNWNKALEDGWVPGETLFSVEEAAEKGNERADLALKVFTQSIRHYLGGYLTILAGADAIVFTGGIGENSQRVRAAVCENLEWAGIKLDTEKNQSAKGECELSHTDSKTKIWVIPTNEELVVARQSAAAVKRYE